MHSFVMILIGDRNERLISENGDFSDFALRKTDGNQAYRTVIS